MKRPTDLLVSDPHDESAGQRGFANDMQSDRSPAHKEEGAACRTGGPFEYGQVMAGLAESLKARNKRARQTGGVQADRAKEKSRKTLSNTLGKIFDTQADAGQDEVAVRRPAKTGRDDR